MGVDMILVKMTTMRCIKVIPIVEIMMICLQGPLTCSQSTSTQWTLGLDIETGRNMQGSMAR